MFLPHSGSTGFGRNLDRERREIGDAEMSQKDFNAFMEKYIKAFEQNPQLLERLMKLVEANPNLRPQQVQQLVQQNGMNPRLFQQQQLQKQNWNFGPPNVYGMNPQMLYQYQMRQRMLYMQQMQWQQFAYAPYYRQFQRPAPPWTYGFGSPPNAPVQPVQVAGNSDYWDAGAAFTGMTGLPNTMPGIVVNPTVAGYSRTNNRQGQVKNKISTDETAFVKSITDAETAYKNLIAERGKLQKAREEILEQQRKAVARQQKQKKQLDDLLTPPLAPGVAAAVTKLRVEMQGTTKDLRDLDASLKKHEASLEKQNEQIKKMQQTIKNLGNSI